MDLWSKYTISDPSHKPYSVTVVYYMLVAAHMIPAISKNDWVPIMGALLRDQTLHYARQRLQWKIEYTNIVYSLLAHEFTFGELQNVYEAILGRRLDKRNFRKKILSLGMLKDTGRKKALGRARPAEVYSFKVGTPSIIEIL